MKCIILFLISIALFIVPFVSWGGDLECTFASSSTEKGVLIAWVTDVRKTTQFGERIKGKTMQVERFRPLATLSGSSIKETLGATIYKGQSFWPVLSPGSKPLQLVTVSSFLDRMGEDHCVYSGTLEKKYLPNWTLLSSAPLAGVFRKPTQNDRDEFCRLNTTCVKQGDYPAGQKPPCVRPVLLAISAREKGTGYFFIHCAISSILKKVACPLFPSLIPAIIQLGGRNHVRH